MQIIRAFAASALLLFTSSYFVLAAEPQSEKLASGVVVTTVKKGDGASPNAGNTVVVHYTGSLPDGTVFDSSVKKGAPAQFPLSRVIPCWTQGVQKMRAGGKAVLMCPPATAYGDRGIPGRIPPGTPLRFEVELISVLTP